MSIVSKIVRYGSRYEIIDQGVPFNIASYSLLTMMLARLCRLEPGEFIHCMGDAHVYLDHVDALKVQIGRAPLAFPTVNIKKSSPLECTVQESQDAQVDAVLKSLLEIEFDDIELDGYAPHPKIVMSMSV